MLRQRVSGDYLQIWGQRLLYGFGFWLLPTIHQINFAVATPLLLHRVVVRGVFIVIGLQMGALVDPWHFWRRGCLKFYRGWVQLLVLWLLLDDLIAHWVYEQLRFVISGVALVVYLGKVQGLGPLLFHLRVVSAGRFRVVIVVVLLTW